MVAYVSSMLYARFLIKGCGPDMRMITVYFAVYLKILPVLMDDLVGKIRNSPCRVSYDAVPGERGL